jgi:hypothetical protein
MFPNRNLGGKAKYKIYEYKYFLAASKKFPKFGTQGSLAMRKREVGLNKLNLFHLVRGNVVMVLIDSALKIVSTNKLLRKKLIVFVGLYRGLSSGKEN